jgi:hypothetical protein
MELNRRFYGTFIHYVLLPVLLVGSDLLIGFLGHYIGSTEQWLSPDTLLDYIVHVNLSELALVLLISFVVVIIVEMVVRLKR